MDAWTSGTAKYLRQNSNDSHYKYYLLRIPERTLWLFFEILFLLIQKPRYLKSFRSHIMSSWFLITRQNHKIFLNLYLTLFRTSFYSGLTFACKSQIKSLIVCVLGWCPHHCWFSPGTWAVNLWQFLYTRVLTNRCPVAIKNRICIFWLWCPLGKCQRMLIEITDLFEKSPFCCRTGCSPIR